MSTAGTDLVRVLVAFTRRLRAEGVPAGSGDLLTFTRAAAVLDPTDLTDLYWAGRVCLVTRRDHLTVYDRVFAAFFLDRPDPVDELVRVHAGTAAATDSAVQVPAAEPGDDREEDEAARLGPVASDMELLRTRSFAGCTDDELVAIRRIMAAIRLSPPRRRTRRTRPARSGPVPHLRATLRRSLRSQGVPIDPAWRRRRMRTRPLVLLLDVSGSMADHSRALLQFAHGTQHAARSVFRVEVFCFGTRLTRLTAALRTRHPDDALRRAAAEVVDWEGGTRIGDAIEAFVRGPGRRGAARGAVVLICSDGHDRGSPAVLSAAMERLARLCHRIVWVSPHPAAVAGRGPVPVGMMVAEPHVTAVAAGHDLRSLEQLAALLPTLR
ncbi:VWA domain-containing protein [Pseudonocardia kongjuensis]|uniref:VWA domain-containing protein n=1 Tax=Pseudonocardia kongjuensis TaxID=102227 RepID=A0ABP4IGY9_9PSEU